MIERLNIARSANRHADIRWERSGTAMITTPVVIRPILLPLVSVNQTAPSGPAVIPSGTLPSVGVGNSVMVPAGVILPMLLRPASVNHRFPSGPAATPED